MTEAALGLGAEEQDALTQLVLRGMYQGEPSPAQQALVDAGLASARGAVMMPTQAGVQAVSGLLKCEKDSETEQKIYQLFTSFLPINRKLREVCTDWQRLPDGSPNDHTDSTWDAGVRDRLDGIHAGIGRILKRLSSVDATFDRYREQLGEALAKFDGGDRAALASPLSQSYHNVWMWLHQHLILMLGLSRKEDEELEEKLVREQSD
ncbi:MAG: hypothetical protein QOI15_2397 [Pseudonocardiales bacterium]|nr:hypothetical protein [Pseudonocardiales bacterium]